MIDRYLYPILIEQLSIYEIKTSDLVYRSPNSLYIEAVIPNYKKLAKWRFIVNSMHMLRHLNYPGFRNGPIPHTGGWRSTHGHRYRGKHSHSLIGEYRSTHGFLCDYFSDLEDAADIIDIGNCPIRIINHRRYQTTKRLTIDYEEIHSRGGKGHGWKRSRKLHQWS